MRGEKMRGEKKGGEEGEEWEMKKKKKILKWFGIYISRWR